jgi:ammonia channel protein AmtB
VGYRILLGAVAVGGLAFLAMLAVTVIWMTVPERIVYRESSPVQTSAFRIEVKQHGTSFFVTPAQKETLDRISSGTPWIWFGGFAIAVAAIVVGAAARLRLRAPTRTA